MIKVNEQTCIGCGACVAIAPDNFDFNESGLSKAISEEITDTTREAAASCPVNAITIKEESSKAANIIDFPSNNREDSQNETTSNAVNETTATENNAIVETESSNDNMETIQDKAA